MSQSQTKMKRCRDITVINSATEQQRAKLNKLSCVRQPHSRLSGATLLSFTPTFMTQLVEGDT